MAVLADLTEEEAYFFAILQDQSGIDQAEFSWTDGTSRDGTFRCWDFQYPWYRTLSKHQIDQCGRAIGKSLDVLTPIPTPGGWTTMGDLEVGDLVYAPNGRPVPVTRVFEVRHDRPCYEITFSTGDSIVADAEHLWTLTDKKTRQARTLATQEILDAGLRKGAREWRWHVEIAAPITGLRHMPLPIPPWLLGYWLGDGTSRTGQITVGEQDIDEFVTKVATLGFATKVRKPRQECAAHMVSLTAPDGTQFGRLLTAVGAKLPDRPGLLRGRKTVPELYLLASIEDRLELLRGFMDADGHATKLKRAEFDLMDFDLAEQMTSLVASLGERPTCRTEDATLNGRVLGQRRRVGWQPTRFNPFGYARKADRISLSERVMSRSIRSIVAVPTRPVRCIAVDSDDRLFLAGRSYIPTHNSVGIQMRAWAFAFTNPEEEMLITAPEMIHLDPVTNHIEERILGSRMSREFLKKSGTSNGITHRPFEAKFRNGASIKGRIPQKDGRGVKGMHPKKLEMDEAQDYPEPGWVELGETLKYGEADATWRSHGVSRGVRDRYYKQTQPESGWHVHRYTGMHRPDWTQEEREAKAELYGSRDHPDYRRNILGLHGDASSALFVLTRLMACVDQNQSSFYNADEYYHVRINDEKLRDTRLPIAELLQFPATHKAYERTWVGMDVGMTNHPSEILVFGEEYPQSKAGGRKDELPNMRLKCLARIHLERISSPDQRRVLEAIWEYYRPQGIAMDRTGLGLPIYQEIAASAPAGMVRVMRPYNFSEKIVIGYERDEDERDYWDPDNPYGTEIKANVLEYSSDMLRQFVDQKQILLPWDIDMIREFQGQTYVVSKSNTNAYGKKQFNKGKFHALDAARMALLGHLQEKIDAMAEVLYDEPVLDSFLV